MGKKNKRGWIKVVEAFMAVMMLLAIVFLIVNNNALRSEDKSNIEDRAGEILRNIQFNDSLRGIILNETNFSRDSIDAGFPLDIAKYANDSIVGFFCYFNICNSTSLCDTTREFDSEVYAKDILIITNLTSYNPRKLKIFCVKE